MANVCDTIKIGRGTKVLVAAMGANCVEPTLFSLTLAVDAARDVTAPATITIPALPTGVDVPVGAYLQAVNPDGSEALLQLAATAIGGATTLSVTNIPINLVIGAIISYPLVLAGRTTAGINDTGNRIDTYTLDSEGYSIGRVVSRSAAIDLGGNYSPLNAGYKVVEWAARNFKQVYLWIEEVPPNANYVKGTVRKGVASVINVPVMLNANDITKTDLTMQFEGGYVVVDPQLAP